MPQSFMQGLLLTAGTAQELPPGSILHLDKSLLIEIGIMWFNLIVLTALLAFILYKPVRKFMADRTERIRLDIETARTGREEAQDLKEKYEQLIAGIEKEREEILHQAHKKAMERSDQLLFNARREADVLYNRAMAELELERKNVTDEMKKQMIEISMLVAGQFVEVSMDRETQDRYIEEALADWEGS